SKRTPREPSKARTSSKSWSRAPWMSPAAQMIMASSGTNHAEESLRGQAKAHGLFPGVEKSPRERLARDGDGSRVLEPDAGANSHLCTDAIAIAEVFLEERSGLSCDVAGNGMFCKLRQCARQ